MYKRSNKAQVIKSSEEIAMNRSEGRTLIESQTDDAHEPFNKES
jgi:hypothetical protein